MDTGASPCPEGLRDVAHVGPPDSLLQKKGNPKVAFLMAAAFYQVSLRSFLIAAN